MKEVLSVRAVRHAQYPHIDLVTVKRLTTLRTTTETTNVPGEGDLKGFAADFTFAARDNLTLTANYAHAIVDIPATKNSFPEANGLFISVPFPIYRVNRPENSGSVARASLRFCLSLTVPRATGTGAATGAVNDAYSAMRGTQA